MTSVYDKEFKVNAVRLYLSGGNSLDKIAKDLGVSRSSLGKWVSCYQKDGDKSFPGKGYVVDKELQSLRRELYLVKQERDILKKAMAIFSEPRSKSTRS